MTQWIIWCSSRKALATAADGVPIAEPVSGSWQEIRDHVQDAPVHLVLPAEWGLLTEVTVPKASDSQLHALVSFAVEEQLATDIESQHLAFKRVSEDRVRVVVISKAHLHALFEELAPFSFKLQGVYLESDLLPDSPSQTQLVWREGHVILKALGQSPVVLDVEPMSEILRLLSKTNADDAVLYLDKPTLKPDDTIRALEAHFRSFTVREAQAGLEPWLAPRVLSADPINLATLNFEKHLTPALTLRRTMPVLVLAAVFMILTLLPPAFQFFINQAQADAQRQRLSVVAQGFGRPLTSTQDVRTLTQLIAAQVNQQHERTQHGFIGVLHRLAPLMTAHPELSLETVQYTGTDVTVGFVLKNPTEWSSVEPQLTALGWTAKAVDKDDPSHRRFGMNAP